MATFSEWTQWAEDKAGDLGGTLDQIPDIVARFWAGQMVGSNNTPSDIATIPKVISHPDLNQIVDQMKTNDQLKGDLSAALNKYAVPPGVLYDTTKDTNDIEGQGVQAAMRDDLKSAIYFFSRAGDKENLKKMKYKLGFVQERLPGVEKFDVEALIGGKVDRNDPRVQAQALSTYDEIRNTGDFGPAIPERFLRR